MARKQSVEESKECLDSIRKWQGLEDQAMAGARRLLAGTKNPLVRMTMELILHDSEKHKLVQQMILDYATKESLHISPDELDSLSEVLNKHVEAESDSLCIAEAVMKESELFITRFLLSYLIADEAKHHALVKQLDDLKRATIPTSTGSRSYGYIERPPSDIERAHAPRGR